MRPTPSRCGHSLRELFPQAQIFGERELRISSCCSDWTQVQDGDLFVALCEDDFDSHELAEFAVQRGASAVLAERLLPLPVPVILVDDTRQEYSRLCQQLTGSPCLTMETIGVTGSHGKTTTALLIASILECSKRGVGIVSSLGNCDGLESSKPLGSSVETPELASWLRRMHANGCDSAVLEADPWMLAKRRLAGVELDAAVVTNIRRGDLRLHNTEENYSRAIQRIFDQLKPHGFAVFNADDTKSRSLLRQFDGPAITIGMRNQAEITAAVLESGLAEQTILLSAGNESVPLRTRIVGDHHIYNALEAVAVGLVMGIDLMTCVRGIEQVESLPGRMESINCGQDFNVFVDAARSPDRLHSTLNTVKRLTTGKVICVMASRPEDPVDERPMLGRVVERFADHAIISSDNPGITPPLEIAHDILDGFDCPAKAHLLPGRRAAIHQALQMAKPGDTVLIAGKGQQTGQLIDGCRAEHDDRQVARDWLYAEADPDNFIIPFPASA